MRVLVAIGLLLIVSVADALARTQEQRVLHNTLNDYITPAYWHLAQTTDILSERLTVLCLKPSRTHLQDAQQAFHGVAEAWSSVEWFRAGPVLHNNRGERFFFFPDRKNRGLRQVRAVLRKRDAAVLDGAELRKRSVALQGLGALDVLLFDKEAEALERKSAFRCPFAEAVSQNLNRIASNLANAWQKDAILRTEWGKPAPENKFFRTNKEAMDVLIGTLIHGLGAIRDTRIAVFLRTKPGRDRPKSAPLWRSGATMASIVANLEGLEKLFTQSRIETLLPQEARYLGDIIRFEFEQSIKTATALDIPIEQLLANLEHRERAVYLKQTINFLIDRINDEFAPAVGLAAGFSFGDGD